MIFNKLQLNEFGKFSNKEIELQKNINVIKGNNESGKTTIQKFIVSMLYGISKDKRKSNFTDYDKYYPWGKESFSGKIKYTLDDKKTYEVYRDFTKKNPIVYNENAEDITSMYKKTTKGSTFFEEQTGIDEKTMISSMVTEQANVVIDQASENFLIQKIANLAETGDERTSYDNAQKYLTKKRNEEVGTDKTRNRPINNLYEEKKALISEKEELEKYSEEQYEIDKKIKEIIDKQKKNERLLDFSKKYKNILDQEMELNNKILIYQDNLKENDKNQDSLEANKKELESKLEEKQSSLNETIKKQQEDEARNNEEIKALNDKKDKKNKFFIILSVLFIIIGAILLLIGLLPIGIVLFICSILSLVLKQKATNKIKKQIDSKSGPVSEVLSSEEESIVENIKNELNEANFKIDVIKENSTEINKNIQEINNQIQENEDKSIKDLISQFEDISEAEYSEILNKEKISNRIDVLQNIKGNYELEIQKYNYRKKYIIPKIERLAEIEEKLYAIDEREDELLKEAESIELASQVLKEAYEEMKENVVPKFTSELSETISQVSNGKYSKVVTNDKDGLLVEKENGEYIPAKALSMGTIDQLYLSLRFAITKEATDERMPIILDEAFAYYDSNRLMNIINYIYEKFTDNQVLIFTCSSREIELLNQMKINYNLIEL